MASNENLALRGSTRPRLPRSRNGCLTCRRRKVRCNEQRPRCSHCERLDLQCAWKTNQPTRPTTQLSRPHGDHQPAPLQGLLVPPDPSEENFDFNTFLWQRALHFDSNSLDWSDQGQLEVSQEQGARLPSSNPDELSYSIHAAGLQEQDSRSNIVSLAHPSDTTNLSPASWTSTNVHLDVERNALVEHFLASVVPPILAIVETGPRWTTTKLLLSSLAAASDMVQDAIAAFSALQVNDAEQDDNAAFRVYYDRSKEQVMHCFEPHGEKIRVNLSSALVTVFFLSYSALLSDRVEDAHLLLQLGAQMVGGAGDQLTSTEKRLISWIRLVDGRASSAGGSGLFLSETDRHANSHEISVIAKSQGSSSDPDDIEGILFDMLYTPGLVFYQRVQSIMARVSGIDKWHRPRGSVKDETEVMAIAATISNALLTIEAERPALMDPAVAGTLTDKYLTADLSSAIVRSYRTYWANYHAGHIHLHRVAYIHLEPSAEVNQARTTIKSLTRLLEKSHDHLPANLIWPLLMAGCEEDDADERAWIISAIQGMQSSATNARPIAHVLAEVHRRQDATQRRADIRQTSIDLFNKSFAVF